MQVTIRRRPPSGFQQQGCGPMKFRTEQNDGNTPRNILEEIIWCVGLRRHAASMDLRRLSSASRAADGQC
jgi:hypothetical protein